MLTALEDGSLDYACMEQAMRVMEYEVPSECLKRVSISKHG